MPVLHFLARFIKPKRQAMGFIKKQFRQIKKFPRWVFIPFYLLIKLLKFTMKSSMIDPFGMISHSAFPYVTITWHNRLLFFPAMFTKDVTARTAAMISPSRDGQYLSDIVSLFGVTPVRGSSSKKGVSAMLESVRFIEKGFNVSITPDGPRGPKYSMSAGPVVLASMTGRPIVPMTVNYSKYWALKSWDGFRIPKPFSEVKLIVGEPINIPQNLDDAEIEKWRVLLQDTLNKLSVD